MSPCATYEDVSLVLRLYEIRREERLRDARRWFAKECKAKTLDELDKLCPVGSVENESFRMVVSYWEMVASFLTSGVLHKDIFFESNRELLLTYERVSAVLPALRERFSDARFLKNLEDIAPDYIAWYEAQAPGAHEAFAARIGAR
jgi:hypothetical protein